MEQLDPEQLKQAGRFRTLIVDDCKSIRTFVRKFLEQMGAECAEAEDGCAALSALRTGQGFDLMLLDVNMPLMNGLECVRQLREEWIAPGMKVMMVTTEVDHSFIERALGFGADEFLMKPFSQESLRDKLMLMGFGMAA